MSFCCLLLLCLGAVVSCLFVGLPRFVLCLVLVFVVCVVVLFCFVFVLLLLSLFNLFLF